MLSHRALWPPSPHTSRYQKTQPRTSYFICIKLNTWHVCMFSPEPSPLPDIFTAPYDPSAAVRLKRSVELMDLGPFSTPSICQASWGLLKQLADASPLSSCGGSWPLSAPALSSWAICSHQGTQRFILRAAFSVLQLIHSFHMQLWSTY